MPTHRIHLSLWACLLGPVLCACEGKPDGARVAPAAFALGAPAPPFAGTTMRGEPLALADLRGKVVLVNIWATWCEPCRDELPELQALHARLQDRGLTVLGVSIDAARERRTLSAMIAGFGLTYPVIHDEKNQISGPFKIVGYPTSVLLDRAGVVRWRRDGLLPSGDPELAAILETTLAEPAP